MATKVPVLFYSGLSQVPGKTWRIGLTPSTTPREILASIGGALKLSPDTLTIVGRVGDKEGNVPDTASLLVIHNKWTADGQTENKFVIRTKAAEAPKVQEQPATTPTSQPAKLPTLRVPESSSSSSSSSSASPRGPAVSPRGAPPVSAPAASAEELEAKKTQVLQNLEKLDTQVKAGEQKTKQLQTALAQIDKQIASLGSSGSFDGTAQAQAQQQRRQIVTALETLETNISQRKEKLTKLKHSLALIEKSLGQSPSATSSPSASSSGPPKMARFEPDPHAESKLNIPDYVADQIETEWSTNKNAASFPECPTVVRKLIFFLTVPELQERFIKLVAHLGSDETNIQWLLKTRMCPAIVSLFKSTKAPIIKSATTLLLNLTQNSSDNSLNACKAGAVPLIVSHLMDSDATLVSLLLSLLSQLLITSDEFVQQFRFVRGMLSLLELIREGSDEEKFKALELVEKIGFSNVSEAQLFARGGAFEMVIRVVDKHTEVPEEHLFIAIKVFIDILTVVPTEPNQISVLRKIVDLLNAKNKKETILFILAKLTEATKSSDSIRTLAFDAGTIKYCFELLKNPVATVVIASANLLSTVLVRPAQQADFRKRGGLTIIKNIFMSGSSSIHVKRAILHVQAALGFLNSLEETQFINIKGLQSVIEVFRMLDSQAEKDAKTFETKKALLQLLCKLSHNPQPLVTSGALDIIVDMITPSTPPDLLDPSLICLSSCIKNSDTKKALSKFQIIDKLALILAIQDESIILKTLNAINFFLKESSSHASFLKIVDVPTLVVFLSSSSEAIRKSLIKVLLQITSPSSTSHPFANRSLTKLDAVPQLIHLMNVDAPELCMMLISNLAKVQGNERYLTEPSFLQRVSRLFKSRDYALQEAAASLLGAVCIHSQARVQLVELGIVELVVTRLTDLTLILQKQTNQTQVRLAQLNLFLLRDLCLSAAARQRAQKTSLAEILLRLKNNPDPALQLGVVEVFRILTFPSEMIDNTKVGIDDRLHAKLSDQLAKQSPRYKGAFSFVNQVLSKLSKQKFSKAFVLAELGQELEKTNSLYESGLSQLSSALSARVEELEKSLAAAEDAMRSSESDCNTMETEIKMMEEDLSYQKTELEQIITLQVGDVADESVPQREEEIQQTEMVLEEAKTLLKDALEVLRNDEATYNKAKAEYDREKNALQDSSGKLSAHSPVLPPEVVETLKNKRMEIIAEIVALENSLLSRLESIESKYIDPLAKLSKLIDPNDLNNPITSAEWLDEIFGNTRKILDVHRSFSEMLHKRAMNYEEGKSKLGDFFNKSAPYLQCHLRFALKFEQSFTAIRTISTSHKDSFGQWLGGQFQESGRGLEMAINEIQAAFLETFVFVHRMHFLLRKLFENTMYDHVEFRGLKTALLSWKDLEKSVISGKDEEEIDESQVNAQSYYQRYEPIIDLFTDKSFAFVDIISELNETDKFAGDLVRLMSSEGNVLNFLKYNIRKEVERVEGESTLFRANTLQAQVLSAYAHHIGRDYVQNCLKPLIDFLRHEAKTKNYEPNEMSLSPTDGDLNEQVQTNRKNLFEACQLCFTYINGTIDQCPPLFFEACYLLSNIVATRFPTAALTSVGGLVFLRFLCPCFVAPERYKLARVEEIDKKTRRNLILVGKVLQNLSNNLPFGKKEPFMIPLNDFIEHNLPSMQALQKRIATPQGADVEDVASRSLMEEAELFRLHTNLKNSHQVLLGFLNGSRSGVIHSMTDKFVHVMQVMGEPKPPADSADGLVRRDTISSSLALPTPTLQRNASKTSVQESPALQRTTSRQTINEGSSSSSSAAAGRRDSAIAPDRTSSRLSVNLSEEDDEGKSRKSSVLRNLMRRSSMSRSHRSASILEVIQSSNEDERRINYQPLVRLLVKNDFQLAQIVWDFASISEGELINKFLVKLFVSEGCAATCLRVLIEDEVKNNQEDSTLFRGNNISPKFISEYAQYVGRDYVVAILRPLIMQIISTDESLEVDGNKMPGDEEAIKVNQRKLIRACEQWFDAIAATVDFCPTEIRCASSLLKKIVGAKFPTAASISVGGLFFLRFIAPVIVAPERVKIVDKPVGSIHRRNLILISKVLQNLSNNINFGKKEPFMEPINEFIDNYRPHMRALQDSLADVQDSDFELLKEKSVFNFEEANEMALIHKVIAANQTQMAEKLTKYAAEHELDYPLVDSFNSLLVQMGPPKTAPPS